MEKNDDMACLKVWKLNSLYILRIIYNKIIYDISMMHIKFFMHDRYLIMHIIWLMKHIRLKNHIGLMMCHTPEIINRIRGD
jgi:hypothetical protein